VSSKAFSMMLIVVVVIGGVIGGALSALGDDDTPARAALPAATPTPTADANDVGGQLQSESSGDFVPDGGTGDGASGGRGRFGGGGFTPIAGTLASIDSTGVTVTTTQGESVVPIPPETPVRLSKTIADASGYLTPGVELVAFLTRETDGTFSAANIVVGGFGGGGGGLGGGRAGGGLTQDGIEFNAVTGTVTAFTNGVLSLKAADGAIDVTVAGTVPVQLTIAFSAAAGELALGETIIVLGQTAEDGTFTPITMATGDLGRLRGEGFGGGRRGGNGQGGGGAAEGIMIEGVFGLTRLGDGDDVP
jgi:hypothetical protein